MSTHEATLLPASGEPPLWFTACACGWTGDPHDSRGAALADYAHHLTTKD